MTPPTNSVEILQTQVDQVKIDLDALKKETSEESKKAKAEVATEKVKNAKVEITKKLDELKKLGEENNKVEIEKLQAMLINLEDFDDEIFSLQHEVIQKEIQEDIDKTAPADKTKVDLPKEAPGKSEEKKGWLRKQRDVFSDSTEENHIRKNTARIAGGIGIAVLAYKGIQWLFGGGKKKEENKEGENGKKTEKTSRWKKALLRGGGILGGIAVWKNRDTIKGRFGGLFGGKKEEEKPEEKPKDISDFEELPEEMKQKYYDVSTDVDDFTAASFSGESLADFSKNFGEDTSKKAEIIFDLDHTSKNLHQLFTHETVDYVKDETTDSAVTKVLNRGKDKVHDIVGPFLLRLSSFTSFVPIFDSDPIASLEAWLGNSEEHKKELSSFYKEYMNVLYYASEKTKVLKEKAAKETIMGKTHLTDTPTADQQGEIDALVENEIRSNNFLQSHTLADIPVLLKQYSVGLKEVSVETQETITNLKSENDKILQKDETGKTVLDRASDDFATGGLEKDTRDDLKETCEDFLKLGFGSPTKIGFLDAYTHLITDIFGNDTESAQNYIRMTDPEHLMIDIHAAFAGYIQKLENNTFTADDLVNMKEQTTKYLAAKDQYKLQMEGTVKEMDKGIHIDWIKVLRLPLDAFKDIGKAFSKDTNSRWEKTGRGLGGFLVEGGFLYGFGIGLKWAGKETIGSIVKIGGKECFRIGKLPITVVEKVLKVSLGKTFLTGGRGWENHIVDGFKSKIFSAPEAEDLLKYAFVNGEIDEARALDIAKKINLSSGGRITNISEVLKRWKLTDKQIDVFLKYRTNKNLAKFMFAKDQFETSLLARPKEFRKYNIMHRTLRKQIKFDFTTMDRISDIDIHINKLTNPTEKEIFFNVLKNTKNLDQAERLVIMGIKPEYIKYFEKGADKLISAKEFGKYLSKYGDILDAEKMDKFMKFIIDAKKANKIVKGSENIFILNSMKKFNDIEKMGFKADQIDKLELNISRLDKRINAMKDNFRKSAETLRKLIKDKRTPYPSTVESTANGLDDLAKASNEDLSLFAESERIGNGSRVSAMSKNSSLLKELSPLFKNDAFVKELSKAKTPEAVKELLASKGINNVPEEFATTLSKTTSTKKIVDTMRYVERYETLGKIGKVLQNPAMKYAGRMLGRVLGVGAIAWGLVTSYQTYQEGSQLIKTNKERGELMQEESFADVGLTAAGACAFIPGIGRVAAGVIVAVTGIASVVKESVYDTLDKYSKNYKDFAASKPLLIKEHILTTALGSAGEDRGFGDRLLGTDTEMNLIMKYLAAKTGSEGIKALLYAEEWKKNFLASLNINDSGDVEFMKAQKPPITNEQVGEAIDIAEKNVEIRYEYLKKKCGVYTFEGKQYINVQKVVSVDKIKKGAGMRLLDQLMLESEYALANPEQFGDPQKIEQSQKETKNILDQDKQKFGVLEKLFTKDKESLLYMYRFLNEYRNHLAQYGFDETGTCIEPEYDVIVKNMEYFDNYMKYKTLDQGIDVVSYSPGFTQPNLITTRDFFASFALDKPLADKELYNSPNKLQTILYRIATEVIGARINNTMDDIKQIFDERNEKMYGLYFDDGKLNVNGNYFADTEYTGINIETIKKIRTDIQEQVTAGDLVDVGTGDVYLNKEIGNKYLTIINQELARS